MKPAILALILRISTTIPLWNIMKLPMRDIMFLAKYIKKDAIAAF